MEMPSLVMASYSLATDYYKQREFAITVIPEVEVATAEPQHVLRVLAW